MTHDGVQFGLKAHEFRKFVALPVLTGHDVRDRSRRPSRRSTGRRVAAADTPGASSTRSPVAADPFAFRRYVQQSGAEFSVAQGIYVETRSGWFSDRTVRYLASGKPALVQDTGFGRNYPAGRGLVPFRTLEEAVRGADLITRDYEVHARSCACDRRRVLRLGQGRGGLLQNVGVTS